MSLSAARSVIWPPPCIQFAVVLVALHFDPVGKDGSQGEVSGNCAKLKTENRGRRSRLRLIASSTISACSLPQRSMVGHQQSAESKAEPNGRPGAIAVATSQEIDRRPILHQENRPSAKASSTSFGFSPGLKMRWS